MCCAASISGVCLAEKQAAQHVSMKGLEGIPWDGLCLGFAGLEK